uniref:hypothetical protein n=1 Tax=Polaromonas sp. H6N TaxID=1840293 RepID=UPI0015E82859|nr:hypothetical protein [Polaromonas sp. H6N]
MNSHRIGGWKTSDWRDIGECSEDLFRCAANLDLGIVSGGDVFEQGDVIALVGRLDIIVRRLRELSKD